MTTPHVSIIWLNYNSMKILDLVMESLKSIVEFDYPQDRYELIIVDNGSTDGSFEKIKDFIERKNSLKKKVIKLNKNLGFTGGNNVGFKARDKASKYIVLVNNDAIPFKESLSIMVEYAEQYNVGGLNGIILRHEEKSLIDTAGGFLDELLFSYTLGFRKPAPWIFKKPIFITYADGAYSLFNVNAILKTTGEKLFFDEFFGYGDDNVLGLLLWNNNYKVISIPKPVAYHQRSSTFGRGVNELPHYLGFRNQIALFYLTNTRYKNLFKIYTARIVFSKILKTSSPSIILSIRSGIKLGRLLKNKYGVFIDVYKAPLLRISYGEFIRYHIMGTKEKLVKLKEDKLLKLIKDLEVD
ncbi:MAG: glycosyltransferase family 2 protein [Desulfurococcaceae archaeon]